jgi:hypothetical protein
VIRITPLALILTLLLPTTIVVLVPNISASIGLMAAAIFWFVAAFIGGTQPYMLQRSDAAFLALPLSVVTMLSAHVAISNVLVEGVDFGRFAGSCAILMALFIGAHFASNKLLGVPDNAIVRAADLVLVILAILGVAAAAGAPSIGPPGVHDKPVIIFGEPSHFALAALPLLMFRTAISRKSSQFLLLGGALTFAATLQNLTMVVGVLGIAAVVMRQTLLLLLLTPVAGAGLVLDITYYAERLALSSDSNNLTTLVFLQGWQNAILNFGETRGFGLGFQQFGIAGSTGDIAQKINQMLSGNSISLLDGGTTATKLIGEFGVFGILLLILLVIAAIRSALFIRRSQTLPSAGRDVKRLFFCALITTYLVELFIRGVGYFSPGGFLALVSVLSLYRMRSAPRQYLSHA